MDQLGTEQTNLTDCSLPKLKIESLWNWRKPIEFIATMLLMQIIFGITDTGQVAVQLRCHQCEFNQLRKVYWTESKIAPVTEILNSGGEKYTQPLWTNTVDHI